MSHQVQSAIDKNISLEYVMNNWHEISSMLGERKRKRMPQMTVNVF